MEHPSKEKIQEIAYKQLNGGLFSEDEIKAKDHFNGCRECRDYFIDCMAVEDFFISGKLDWFYEHRHVMKTENTVETQKELKDIEL